MRFKYTVPDALAEEKMIVLDSSNMFSMLKPNDSIPPDVGGN